MARAMRVFHMKIKKNKKKTLHVYYQVNSRKENQVHALKELNLILIIDYPGAGSDILTHNQNIFDRRQYAIINIIHK